MHAARLIRSQNRQQQAPPPTKPNRRSKTPEGAKEYGKSGLRSPATDSTCTIRDEKPGYKSRPFSRNSMDGSDLSYGKSDKKIDPVAWGKCFCFLGVVVTLIGLTLLLIGMTEDFRPMPFVFGVFSTIAGILILMFGICFVKAADHWPEVNRGRVGSVFIIPEQPRKKDIEANEHRDDDMVQVLTVATAPRLEFANESKEDNPKELPGTVNRSTDAT